MALDRTAKGRLAIRAAVCGMVLALPIPARILAAPPAECSIRLIDVTKSSGIAFRHNHGGSDQGYIVEGMASGMALFDYDGDGLIDICLLGCHWLRAWRPGTGHGHWQGDPGWKTGDQWSGDFRAGG